MSRIILKFGMGIAAAAAIGVFLGERTVDGLQAAVTSPPPAAATASPAPQQTEQPIVPDFPSGERWALRHHPASGDACPDMSWAFHEGCTRAADQALGVRG